MIEAFKLIGEIAIEGGKGVKADLDKIEKKTKDAQESFRKFGDGMKNVGANLTQYVTAPLTGLGLIAMKTASDMGSSQAIIQAELGITGKKAERLNEVAKDLWQQGFGQDMADVSTKIAHVTRALGDLSDTDLSYVTKGLDLIEKRGWGDTQETLRAMNTLMREFGMSSQEALDYITAGFQNNLDYSGEFLDTISEYSTYFNEMGMSGQEFFSVLKSGAEGGAFQLDKVGDAMKEFAQRSKDGSETTNDSFKALGLSATKMGNAFNKGGEAGRKAFETVVEKLQGVESETIRNQISTDLFGTQYEDLGEKAFESMLKASQGLENVEGATGRANDSLQKTFGQRFQSTIRTTQASLEPLGIILLDMADKILPPLVNLVTQVATWFSNLESETQIFTVAIGVLTAIIPPLLIFFGMIVNTISTLLPWILKAWNLFKKLRLVFLALSGPIGIAIAIITALISIGVLLYKNWDYVKKKASELWALIKSIFSKFGFAILGPFGAIIQGGINLYKNWDTVKAKAKEIWTNVINKVKETKDKAVKYFTDMKNNATNKFNELKENARRKFDEMYSKITDPIKRAKDKIEGWIKNIKGFFSGLKLSIPKPSLPKMPRIRLKTSSKTIMGKTFSYPTGFEFYAKGGYMDGATLLGMMGGNAQIGGEAGGEGIVPLEGKHMIPIAKQIADFINNTGSNLNGRLEVPLVVNGREVARAIVPNIDQELQRQRQLRKRGI